MLMKIMKKRAWALAGRALSKNGPIHETPVITTLSAPKKSKTGVSQGALWRPFGHQIQVQEFTMLVENRISHFYT